MRINKISVGENPPWDVNAIIEVGVGSDPIKYEMDKESGALFVDRFMHTAMHYPVNYGFIPHTLSDDGDPVDIMVLGTHPIMPMAVVRVRPVGVLVMEDEGGQDEKILSVPVNKLHPYYSNIDTWKDVRPILIDQIQHFFEHYKDLEKGKWVKVHHWGDAEEAADLIRKGIESGKTSG
ncbi:MAG: inorganic diphosphatase [Alphaproteobacteria bacterium]|jgi:inorganic pyrophosphatase|nr:inorganic diphosphatase [Alphaproteobacteria bacterium]